MKKCVILLALLALTLAQPTEEEIQAQQGELSMKRTACLVLSRYHSNTQKDAIESVVTELNPDQQQKYINKMYAMAIEHCLPTITMDEAQKVLPSLFSSSWKTLSLAPRRCSTSSTTLTTLPSSTTSTTSARPRKPLSSS